MNVYLMVCRSCGRTTSKSYARQHARQHEGECKACVTGDVTLRSTSGSGAAVSHNARIIDQGWEGYALEEGHYDDGGDR